MSEKKKEKEKPAGNKLNIVILALLIIIIVGMIGIVGGYFLLVKGKISIPSSTKTSEAAVVQENTYTLDEFTINLADTDSEKYINAQVSLGYDSSQSKLKSELESTTIVKKPILSDAVISVIRSKKKADFDAAGGVDKIKQEIIDAVNKNLTNGKILHVYFSKLVIQ